jgi:cell volume regulation protein A
MSDVRPFGLLVLVGAAVGLLAVLFSRLTERTRIPTPAFFLAGAAVAASVDPDLHTLPHRTVERLVTVALVVILFDGGMHIGRGRFRSVGWPVVSVGVIGTFATAAAVGVLAHVAFGFDWWVSMLLGTAVAPTDPAVVFSVLGKREVAGRSGTILEGESGANDPVGIALMSSLLAAGGLSAGALGSVAGEFVLEMTVGAVVGVVGGAALLWFMRRVPLPSEGLYPLRTLAGAMVVFGAATVAHGSGFLAVFVAGILLGDEAAPYKREIARFHSALASFGEIVAFVLLGLTVDTGTLSHADVWVPGLVIAAALAFAVRPVLVGACLLPVRLGTGERAFVLWAGLKGAVPILLGSFLLSAGVPESERLYGVVVVVVAFSVLVQGGSVPLVARLLRVPMRTVEPEPWALGVRLRDEPQGVHHLTIAPGSPADGATIGELNDISDDVWVSFVIRGGELVPVRGDTRLHARDEVLVLADPRLRGDLAAAFGDQSASGPGRRPPRSPSPRTRRLPPV